MDTATQQQDSKERGKKNEEWVQRKERWVEVNREMKISEAQQLRESREKLGVTREEMSRLMDVSVSCLGRLERGDSIKDFRVIKKYYEFMLDNIKREIDFFNDIRNLY
ncbi:helix-turn-helix domain-containing protein [Alkalibacterium olivapovliticus]|uniref:Helix-turn-helix protein n=1 Tax=Alkalibacterium olivapovliticus TaxID=99907 RepID=A0A2T0W859_9LACT|nr:helix-turn-helix domain-containing protein [Alkalibacterium olivapovliticus]PRY82878.1 helix-turn-helix protein [Alkalibacterium olivapovliticus]